MGRAMNPRRHPISDSAHAQGRQPQRFGPHVPDIARFISTAIEPDSLGLLQEIDQRWPNLSLADYLGARALVAAMRMDVGGHA
jgi:hypothetical protein